MDRGLVVSVAVVSGLAALAVALLRDGLAGGPVGVLVAAAVSGVLAVGGTVALVRVVIAAERSRKEKRS